MWRGLSVIDVLDSPVSSSQQSWEYQGEAETFPASPASLAAIGRGADWTAEELHIPQRSISTRTWRAATWPKNAPLPNNPDFSPLDYHTWNMLQNMIGRKDIPSTGDLKASIAQATDGHFESLRRALEDKA